MEGGGEDRFRSVSVLFLGDGRFVAHIVAALGALLLTYTYHPAILELSSASAALL